MEIRFLNAAGYRSIYRLRVPLTRANVIVGPNGCGKSNLYKSMFLLAEAANGRFAQALAEEGGMPSALWAGPRNRGPVRMTLGVEADDFSYELICGLPVKCDSAFALDPEIKEERITVRGPRGDRHVLMERMAGSAWLRDVEGHRVPYRMVLSNSESILSQIREPQLYPELAMLRMELIQWRFYHHFPTQADAPARNPQTAVRTASLSHDGGDLAAALQTIREIGNPEALREAVLRLLPGATLHIDVDGQCRMSVAIELPNIQRKLQAKELSDGTLRYLYLVAALLSPRPAPLIALNEPETSLHPDMIPAVGQLISQAAQHSQIWIVTHSEPLAASIAGNCGCQPIRLEQVDGKTRLVGAGFDAHEDEEALQFPKVAPD